LLAVLLLQAVRAIQTADYELRKVISDYGTPGPGVGPDFEKLHGRTFLKLRTSQDASLSCELILMAHRRIKIRVRLHGEPDL
jgi:hypothetical protein